MAHGSGADRIGSDLPDLPPERRERMQSESAQLILLQNATGRGQEEGDSDRAREEMRSDQTGDHRSSGVARLAPGDAAVTSPGGVLPDCVRDILAGL